MRDVPYGKWREYAPEDTIRFYGLRLHETGVIKSHPKKILAEGTDWRFLNELKTPPRSVPVVAQDENLLFSAVGRVQVGEHPTYQPGTAAKTRIA